VAKGIIYTGSDWEREKATTAARRPFTIQGMLLIVSEHKPSTKSSKTIGVSKIYTNGAWRSATTKKNIN
jgi:hypothetical protein